MEQERLKRRILEDIQRQLAALLAERGIEGQLSLTHQHAILSVGASSRRAALSQLPSRWRQLTPNQRREQLRPLVEILVQARAHRVRPWQAPVALLSIAAVTLVLGGAIVRDILQTSGDSAGPDALALDEKARSEREQRLCEATRSRVMRGGTAGPADAAGWLVELTLLDELTADAGPAPSLDPFFVGVSPQMKAVAPGSDVLGDATNGRVELHERVDQRLRERRFVLHGDYVRAYFDESGRRAWVALANSLFEHTGATYGALVARCSHQSSHHVGSWFAGGSASAAVAALLHFAGVFSETPVFAKPYLPASRTARPELSLLGLFEKKTQDLDRTQLAMWLSRDQGTVSGREGQSIVIRFPYRDSNRASRASLRVARRLEIASTR